jgi:hypothetical protein
VIFYTFICPKCDEKSHVPEKTMNMIDPLLYCWFCGHEGLNDMKNFIGKKDGWNEGEE